MATSVVEQLVEDLRDSGVQRIYGRCVFRSLPLGVSPGSVASRKAMRWGTGQEEGSTRLWPSVMISLLRMRTSFTMSSRMSSTR